MTSSEASSLEASSSKAVNHQKLQFIRRCNSKLKKYYIVNSPWKCKGDKTDFRFVEGTCINCLCLSSLSLSLFLSAAISSEHLFRNRTLSASDLHFQLGEKQEKGNTIQPPSCVFLTFRLHPPKNGSGFAPPNKWLTLPDMGHIVGTCYNRPVVEITSLDIEISKTFFPIRGRPPVNPKSHIMCIGLIQNHFVLLLLKDDCSLPPSSTEWSIHMSEEAATWEDEFWINTIVSEHS
ncbi:hypothetical protein MTR_7g024793 [Medicago truncatula]|uniref:Uncharacterized protein n=1 Tax=Medicago truncatula TaxID=3880 RepID=A0A072TXM8_MEDTR|nr:hypothetical protein MTR_7g024793 [Medicago truncatula]